MRFSRKEICEFYFPALEAKGQKTVNICKCKTKRNLQRNQAFINQKLQLDHNITAARKMHFGSGPSLI